jgi:hypothetical protein
VCKHTPQRAHLAVKVMQSGLGDTVFNNLRHPARPDCRETKHELHDVTFERVWNRRAAQARLLSARGIVGPPKPAMARMNSCICTEIASAFAKICVNDSDSLHMSLASAIAHRANIHAHCSISWTLSGAAARRRLRSYWKVKNH